MPFTYPAQKIREESIATFLPEGIYDFETVSCVEGVTASGFDKLVLTLDIHEKPGVKYKYQMHITENNAYHLKAYWESVGEPEMFDKLESSHDQFAFIGKSGRVKTNVRENEWEGQVTKRTNIHYFVKPEKSDASEAVIVSGRVSSSEEFIDDEIPF